MNKIFIYSLGVFYFIKGSLCNAIEKFEVLPDLPDPLAYAVQPANAASVSGVSDLSGVSTAQTIGQEPNIFSVIISLIFVILLIYVTGILYAKLNKVGFKTLKRQQGDLAKSQVAVISTTPLGNNKTLHVVELDGKRMLIGASASAIQLIKDLGSIGANCEDSEYSHIEIPNIKIPKIEIPKIEIPSIGFSKLVTKTHKPLNKEIGENIQTEDSINKEESVIETDSTAKIEENSDGIIDSLFAQQSQVEETETVVDNSSLEHIVDPEDFALYKKYLS